MSKAERSFWVGLALATSLVGTVAAETQAEIAARENDEGKELMFAGNYAGASAKFQDAVARVPEAKYFFNLCTSLYQEGKFGLAITACGSVDKNNPDDKLKAKSAKLEDRIKADAKQQGIDLQPQGGGGGDPNLTNPVNPDGSNPGGPGGPTGPGPGGPGGPTNPGMGGPGGPTNPGMGGPGGPGGPTGPGVGQPRPPGSYAVGRPPEQGLFKSAPPNHAYTWALGVDLYGGGANIGQDGFYATASGGIRVKADYLVLPSARVGLQGYFQLTNISNSTNSANPNAFNLDIADVGVAGFKHFCLGGRLCITPLAGVQLALMDPNQDQGTGNQTFNYAALGFRLEAAASIAFGHRYEYVFEAMLGTNIYTPVFSSPSDGLTAMEVGLDKGGPAGYAGIGFTYRFNTPLGSSPFVTLE